MEQKTQFFTAKRIAMLGVAVALSYLTTLLSFFIRLVITVGFAGRFGVDVIWWGFNLGWIISLGVAVLRYVQGGWKKKSLMGRKV